MEVLTGTAGSGEQEAVLVSGNDSHWSVDESGSEDTDGFKTVETGLECRIESLLLPTGGGAVSELFWVISKLSEARMNRKFPSNVPWGAPLLRSLFE